MAMFFEIDESDALPIYEQVMRQIKFAVAGGVIRPGELVLSVRELAKKLRINPNTVAKSFQRLQAEGVLVSVRGRGLAVAEGADVKCRVERTELIRERLRVVLDEARRSYIEPADLLSVFQSEIAALEKELDQ